MENNEQLQQGLIQKSEVRQPSMSDSWKWYHTLIVLCIRLIIDFTFKNPLVFYLNYQQGLGISSMQFAYILIAGSFGCIFSIFIGDVNKKYLKTDENIMELWLFISGIASLLIPAFSFFNVIENHELYNIIWCCCMRFIVGLSFAFISAASIKFASEYVPNTNKITSIISILHYSWPLSTAINIIAGYTIEDSWMLVFVFTGIALIFMAFFAKLMFYCFKLQKTERNTDGLDILEEEDRRNGLRIIFTDLNSLLIMLVSFFMTFRSRTIYIVASSLWMETIYNLTPSAVGWTTLSVVIGEVLGLSIMSTISHKFALWISAVGTLSHQLVFGALLFILARIYGNAIPLAAALILIGLLTMGHESFYVVQQSNAIHYAPLPRLKLVLLLGERMAQEAASIVAVIITVMLWDDLANNSVLIFSVLWIGVTFIESFILFVYATPATIKHGFT